MEQERREVIIKNGLNKGSIGYFLSTEIKDGNTYVVLEMDYRYQVSLPLDDVYFMDGKGLTLENKDDIIKE